MEVAVVRYAEPDGRAGAATVEHVVDAALDVDDEGNFRHQETKLSAQIVFDVALDTENGLLRLFRGEQGVIVTGQNAFEFSVIADAGAGQVGLLVEKDCAHWDFSLKPTVGAETLHPLEVQAGRRGRGPGYRGG